MYRNWDCAKITDTPKTCSNLPCTWLASERIWPESFCTWQLNHEMNDGVKQVPFDQYLQRGMKLVWPYFVLISVVSAPQFDVLFRSNNRFSDADTMYHDGTCRVQGQNINGNIDEMLHIARKLIFMIFVWERTNSSVKLTWKVWAPMRGPEAPDGLVRLLDIQSTLPGTSLQNRGDVRKRSWSCTTHNAFMPRTIDCCDLWVVVLAANDMVSYPPLIDCSWWTMWKARKRDLQKSFGVETSLRKSWISSSWQDFTLHGRYTTNWRLVYLQMLLAFWSLSE